MGFYEGKFMILPKKKSLDDMLALVTDENIHSEISTGCAVGKEDWPKKASDEEIDSAIENIKLMME